ncbi:MAG: TIGR01212 family radical SAM protein [Lachnospiraceae bacterium]|nr:TIGR01212 family radical SAM protein [Lachnospiraceae bacterium]
MYDKRMWNDKRYHSLDYYLKDTYGTKLFKLALDAGMTCPNRDGRIGTSGCIFCSQGGSGDFSSSRYLSIPEQINEAKALIDTKVKRALKIGDDSYNVSDDADISSQTLNSARYIAYFQAYTNTYAPISYLRKVYYEAIECPDVEIISIATRPDCLDDEVLELLAEINKIKPVWIELGLQTIHEATAKTIKRGYKLNVYDEAVSKLNALGIDVIVHVILGLPGEAREDMIQTIDYIAKQNIQGVKLQLLHVLKNTALVNYMPSMHILSMDEYTDLVVECIEHLPQEIVIHRLTGDGPKGTLLAPLWSKDKLSVMNQINHKMKLNDSWQGKKVN